MHRTYHFSTSLSFLSTSLGMAPATTAQNMFLYLNATIIPVLPRLYALWTVTP